MDSLRTLLRSPSAGAALVDLNKAGALKSLLPELQALDLPHRAHKDMFLHSVQVFENAVEITNGDADDVLRVAALLHDMGKPATRKIVRGGATFVNHDLVGARMARKVLPSYGYTPEETEQAATLIALHMRGHSFETGWTDSAVRRLTADAGDREQLERLIVIFAADATTSNTAKRNRYRANALRLRAAAIEVLEADARKALRPALNGHEVMELTNLTPGRELGAIMKFLNSDEGIALSREDAKAEVLRRVG